jgi:hypothetical protein
MRAHGRVERISLRVRRASTMVVNRLLSGCNIIFFFAAVRIRALARRPGAKAASETRDGYGARSASVGVFMDDERV